MQADALPGLLWRGTRLASRLPHRHALLFADRPLKNAANAPINRATKLPSIPAATVFRAVSISSRSAYLLGGIARSQWEHSIPPVDQLRYSVTFRTFRERAL
jgi:hypothetical protein